MEGGWKWGILALCLAIFFTDASNSSTIPLYPFYAESLGASVAMIGLVASVTSVSMMLLSIPLGYLSDRYGRKRVMFLGEVCFFAGAILYSLASEPIHLVAARFVLGAANASTFVIGFIYVSELAPLERKGLAQGLYLTSMGSGFTLGPLLGGMTAKAFGYNTGFYLSAGFAVLAMLVLLVTPEGTKESAAGPRQGFFEGFREVLASPQIQAAGTASFFNSMIYSATMVYFPVYGGSVGLDESQVGLGLTVRGMASTATRIPVGMATRRLGALRLMLLGLGVSALMVMAIPSFQGLTLLSVILGIQGVAYGFYLTSGNVYVTDEAPPGMEGAAIGAFTTFSNISGILSPIILGWASENWGIGTTLRGASVLALIGAAAVALRSRKRAIPRTS